MCMHAVNSRNKDPQDIFQILCWDGIFIFNTGVTCVMWELRSPGVTLESRVLWHASNHAQTTQAANTFIKIKLHQLNNSFIFQSMNVQKGDKATADHGLHYWIRSQFALPLFNASLPLVICVNDWLRLVLQGDTGDDITLIVAAVVLICWQKRHAGV